MPFLDKVYAALGIGPSAGSRRARGASDPPPGRALTRKRQRLQDGFISSEGMLTPRACTLRDMTALGGCVEIWDQTIKPGLLVGPLTLYIPGDRHEVDCTVAWRRDNLLGLKFVSPFRPPTRSYR